MPQFGWSFDSPSGGEQGGRSGARRLGWEGLERWIARETKARWIYPLQNMRINSDEVDNQTAIRAGIKRCNDDKTRRSCENGQVHAHRRSRWGESTTVQRTAGREAGIATP